jgi:hydrogenase maturation protein HypF
MWLEQLARSASLVEPYPFPFTDGELDFRPLLENLARDRYLGRDANECARAFQRGIAQGVSHAVTALCRANETDTIVLSGGVFQNELLLEDLKSLLDLTPFQVWTNHAVPANDGGISLGQAALASFGQFDSVASFSCKETASL